MDALNDKFAGQNPWCGPAPAEFPRGIVSEAYDTDAYGNTLVFTGPGADGVWFTDDDTQYSYGANEIIYCGYRFNPETQLYYVRNRTYNPVLGRWLQRDPIGYAGGINLYGYVGGRPGIKTDASGLTPLQCPAAGPPGSCCWRSSLRDWGAYRGFWRFLPMVRLNGNSWNYAIAAGRKRWIELLSIMSRRLACRRRNRKYRGSPLGSTCGRKDWWVIGGVSVFMLLWLEGCASQAGGAQQQLLKDRVESLPSGARESLRTDYHSLVKAYGDRFWWFDGWLQHLIFDSPPQMWEKLRYGLVRYRSGGSRLRLRELAVGLPAGWQACAEEHNTWEATYWVRVIPCHENLQMTIVIPQAPRRRMRSTRRSGNQTNSSVGQIPDTQVGADSDLRRMDQAANSTPMDIDAAAPWRFIPRQIAKFMPGGSNLRARELRQSLRLIPKLHDLLDYKENNLYARDRLFNGFTYAFIGAMEVDGAERAVISVFGTSGNWRGKIFLQFDGPMKHLKALRLCGQLAARITLLHQIAPRKLGKAK